MNRLLVIAVLIMTMACCESIDRDNRDLIQERETQILGSYILDKDNSSMRSYENHDSDWQFVFRADRTFYITKLLPYLVDSVGRWKYRFGSGVAYLELKFKNDLGVEQVLTDSNQLIFLNPQPLKGHIQIERLQLVKNQKKYSKSVIIHLQPTSAWQ